MFNDRTANHIIETAVDAIRRRPDSFAEVLDEIPAAIYVTDADGVISYFNSACAELVGREPRLGRDRWCASWKLYTLDGARLPHDECPMAYAVRERRPVRDAEAIAERPDGSRFRFRPYPTPLAGPDGPNAGAVNLLLDVSRERKPEFLRQQAKRCRTLAAKVTDSAIAATLRAMADKYSQRSTTKGKR